MPGGRPGRCRGGPGSTWCSPCCRSTSWWRWTRGAARPRPYRWVGEGLQGPARPRPYRGVGEGLQGARETTPLQGGRGGATGGRRRGWTRGTVRPRPYRYRRRGYRGLGEGLQGAGGGTTRGPRHHAPTGTGGGAKGGRRRRRGWTCSITKLGSITKPGRGFLLHLLSPPSGCWSMLGLPVAGG